VIQKIFVSLIEIYQNIAINKPKTCRYYPSCSEYTKVAIIKYGVAIGTWMGINRILRCNQFFEGGYDPVK